MIGHTQQLLLKTGSRQLKPCYPALLGMANQMNRCWVGWIILLSKWAWPIKFLCRCFLWLDTSAGTAVLQSTLPYSTVRTYVQNTEHRTQNNNALCTVWYSGIVRPSPEFLKSCGPVEPGSRRTSSLGSRSEERPKSKVGGNLENPGFSWLLAIIILARPLTRWLRQNSENSLPKSKRAQRHSLSFVNLRRYLPRISGSEGANAEIH